MINRRILYFALCLLTALTAAPLLAAEEPIQAKEDPVTEIRLSDHDYLRISGQEQQFILRSDGTAAYILTPRTPGFAGLGPGRYKGHLGQSDFKQLAELLKAQRFFELKDWYFMAYPVDATTTGITQGDKQKTVVTYEGATPAEMWLIQMAIRGVASRIRWVKDEKQTVDIVPSQPK